MADRAIPVETERRPVRMSVASADLTDLLGAAIRKRRSSLGISQEELAVRAGLHRTYVSDVERGARNPSIKTIGKIAEGLQVPVFKLFRDTNDPPLPASRLGRRLLKYWGGCALRLALPRISDHAITLAGTLPRFDRGQRTRVAKLADAPDLGSGGEILRGSSPLPGTGFAGHISNPNQIGEAVGESGQVQRCRPPVEQHPTKKHCGFDEGPRILGPARNRLFTGKRSENTRWA